MGGVGAIIMDGCVVESNSIIAAGADVTQIARVEAGTIYTGDPISGEIERIANNYIKYAGWYK